MDGVDAETTRFPPQNAGEVRARIGAFLREQGVTVLVCAAACGADLIALTEAGELGIRRIVVLPFDKQRFREISVSDRPGEWGPVYDRVLKEVEAAGDLTVLAHAPNQESFVRANGAILDRAMAESAAAHQAVMAVLVWDGSSRNGHDVTGDFGEQARACGLTVKELQTLSVKAGQASQGAGQASADSQK